MMKMKKFYVGLLSVCFTLVSSGFNSAPAFSEQIDLLRSVPLEIKGYEVSKDFPVTFATSSQVLTALDSTPVLLVHMEVLRRGHQDLPIAEQDKLLTALLKRHQQKEHDLQLGFDHGYAQLIYKKNKTGLFFLRKANDKFKTQFSNLAYAMAQIEADLNEENSTPEAMTTRKMDAMYKLNDAVQADVASHQPGFWPAYVAVLEKIKGLPAYNSFANRDFTLAYLPMSKSVLSMGGSKAVTIPLNMTPESLAKNALHTSCNPNASDTSTGSISASSSALSTSALLQLISTEKPGFYRIRVSGSAGQPLLSFETYASNKIVEDLDGDGNYEIVARQYKQDPYNPILVYRYTPCGFELDKTVFNNFH